MSPRDPRFLELTPEEVEADFWRHFYFENQGKGEEFEDEDLDIAELAKQLEAGDGDWENLIDDRS